MHDNLPHILDDINRYYTAKIVQHGCTPQGADWKDEYTQYVRFVQLLKLIAKEQNFTLNDVGCGYGSLFGYMLTRPYQDFCVYGYDLSQEMIKQARACYQQDTRCEFLQITDTKELKTATYSVASGIFNVKMHYKEADWLAYILKTIEDMYEHSQQGFAFNILTRYSDKEYMRNDLYYADPCFFFDYCKRNFSKQVALLHDYGLYEFTILVRKE